MQSAKQINDMFHTKATVHGKPEYVHEEGDENHNDDVNEANNEKVSSLEEDDDDDDDEDVDDDVDDVDDNVGDVVVAVVVARMESIFSILGRITQLNLNPDTRRVYGTFIRQSLQWGFMLLLCPKATT